MDNHQLPTSPHDNNSNKDYDIQDLHQGALSSDNEGVEDDLSQNGIYHPNENQENNNNINKIQKSGLFNNEDNEDDSVSGQLAHLFFSSSRILKSVLYSLAYFKLSAIFLNYMSRKYFHSKITFRWNFYEAFK